MTARHSVQAQVVRIHSQGGPEVLTLESVEIAPPGPGQVLLRQTAIGLNYQDIYHRSGHYSLPLPSGLGTEAAGVVEQVGPDVTDLAPGDRVCYGGGAPGADATHRVIAADRLVRIPDGVSDEQAAAVIMKGMTAEYLLNRCYPVRKGQDVLFYAAAGGVGLLAGQWGAHLGARMIGVASGAAKVALAKANGYAECIDRSTEDVAARLKALTGGKGFPVIYDSVGRDTFDLTLHALAPRGYFVSFGTTTGSLPPVEAATLQKLGSLYFTRPTMATYCVSVPDLRASAAAVFDLVAKGVLKITISQRFALKDLAQAHRMLESGRTTGSTVILP